MLRYSYNKQNVSFVCPRGIRMVSFNYMAQLLSHRCVYHMFLTPWPQPHMSATPYMPIHGLAVTLSHHDAGSLLHAHPGVPLPQHIYSLKSGSSDLNRLLGWKHPFVGESAPKGRQG